MPSDIMDQRYMPSFYRPSVASSFFSEETRFPSEKQIRSWKTASMSDHRGLDTQFLSGGNADSSSSLEKLRSMGGSVADCLELPHNIFKDPKRNMSFEHHLMGAESTANCWRTPDQDIATHANLYSQPAMVSVANRKVTLPGNRYETGLFSSSMSGIFNNKMRLSANDGFGGQSVNMPQSDFAEDEAFRSLEEIEEQTIEDLLPDDDEDLLSGAIYDLGHAEQSNRADVEDDLFCSVGGMELESNENFRCKKASEFEYGGAFDGRVVGLDKPASGELPCGGQPTRSLSVNNIDSNIEDMELRVLFEQYGDIQTLYTSCRHLGFIMVSYYDVRAAQNAKRVLHSKSISGQKLDIRFCVARGNPSEKDIGEGLLLVTNLDPSMSNDDLLHIFGVYGEIKEIYEIPHKQDHKFIKFYDVRSSEAALLALNNCNIAGKRIKVEPCGSRDSISLMQRLSLNLEEEETGRQGGYSKNLPLECFAPSGSITLEANISSSLRTGAIQEMQFAFEKQSSSYMESKYHRIPSGMPHELSSPVRVAMGGNRDNQSGNHELSHSLEQMNLGFQTMPSFPEFHDGVINGIRFESPSTISEMVMSTSSTLANDNRNIHTIGSGGHSSRSFDESAFNASGNGSCVVNGHEYAWNNSSTYNHQHPGSIPRQNLSSFMNNIPAQTPHVHGLGRGASHLPNLVIPQHQHVGSAPVVDHFLWDRRHTFTGDATYLHPSSLKTMGCSSCSPLHSLELASQNIFLHAGRTCIEPPIASAHVGVPSPQQRDHMLRGRNNANSTPNSHDAPTYRIKSRRRYPSASQPASQKQYELDIDRIIQGGDLRTTLMLKNIPNKYTSKMLLSTIDEKHKGTYDFIYLPIDFKNKCNMGYAFINMTEPQHIIPFYQAFNGKKWEKFNSEKVAYLAYARIQGKTALVTHFQNSSLMNEDKRCRPILFHSDGPNAGDQESFPVPVGVNIRTRRSRTKHKGISSGSSSDEEEESSSNGIIGSPSGSIKDS